MKFLVYWALFFLRVFVQSNSLQHPFSGFYIAEKSETYAGAFLMGTQQLQIVRPRIERAAFPEDIIFQALWQSVCTRVHTRDYLDFCVEHLSSFSNMIGVAHNIEEQKPMLDWTSSQLQETVQKLTSLTNSTRSHIHTTTPSSRISHTLCVIPYSDAIANAASLPPHSRDMHRTLRRLTFLATFHSIYKHFPHIAIYVASERDKLIIEKMALPVIAVVDMSSTLQQVPQNLYFKNRPVSQLLPKYTLLDVADKVAIGGEWGHFSYVYYSEGDQILHMRKTRLLLSVLDASNGTVVMVPHRMQVEMY